MTLFKNLKILHFPSFHVILHTKRRTVTLFLRKGVKPVLGRQLSNNPRQIMELLHFLTNKYFFINRNSLASVFAKLCLIIT